MRLFFLRHGDAEERRAGLADPLRRLTPEGLDEMRSVARGMRRLDLGVDAVLSSPYRRAWETAEIAAEALGVADRLRQAPLLASGAGFDALRMSLRDQADDARILLVGHEPDFSAMIATLIGGGSVRMKKAALACVDCASLSPGQSELRWLLEPTHLVVIGS